MKNNNIMAIPYTSIGIEYIALYNSDLISEDDVKILIQTDTNSDKVIHMTKKQFTNVFKDLIGGQFNE